MSKNVSRRKENQTNQAGISSRSHPTQKADQIDRLLRNGKTSALKATKKSAP
jgi:hypothetical protein